MVAVSIRAQCIKLPCVILASHIRVSAQVLLALLPVQLPAKALESSRGLGVWACATHIGELHRVPGSWLQPSPGWCSYLRVNQWIEGHFFK